MHLRFLIAIREPSPESSQKTFLDGLLESLDYEKKKSAKTPPLQEKTAAHTSETRDSHSSTRSISNNLSDVNPSEEKFLLSILLNDYFLLITSKFQGLFSE